MSKVVISIRENKELYKDFNRVVDAYKSLNPDKYTSLERICYLDLIDALVDYMKNMPMDYLRTDDQMREEANKVWLGLLTNNDIDNFCQIIS
jgi:hypothetical protein